MDIFARSICSAALLICGTAFVIVGFLPSRTDVGPLVELIAGGIFLLFGFYGCCRGLGVKVYSGQADWPGEKERLSASAQQLSTHGA